MRGCVHRSELHEGLTNGVTNGFCVKNGFFTRRGFCCNRYEAKAEQSKRAEALKQLPLDKDAEIAMTKERHRLEHERYLINEAIIKEKDAEIKNARGVIEWHEKECKNYIKLHHQKSRSIVAMLFWEWREADNSYKKSRTEKPKPTEKTISLRGMRASQCERLFKQAYKMLKDNA